VTWHFAALPAHSTGRVDLVVHTFDGNSSAAPFADDLIEDLSVYINADNAASALLSPNLIGVWVQDQPFDRTKPEAIHKFLKNFGIDGAQTQDDLATIANSLIADITTDSHVKAIAGMDDFQFPSSGVHVIPMGSDQVMVLATAAGVISNDGGSFTVPLPGGQTMIVAAGGGNIIAAGGGNIVAAGGGNIIAAGGGNAISINNVAGIGGNHDCSYILDHASDIVAAGGGNIVAAGGGNLVIRQNGVDNLVSNHPGGGIISAISAGEIAEGIVAIGGGSNLIGGAGVAIGVGSDLTSMVAHGSVNAVTKESTGMAVVSNGIPQANIQGGAIVAAGGGNIVAAGGGNVVAAGGGNIVAAGGGNIVAAGGGN